MVRVSAAWFWSTLVGLSLVGTTAHAGEPGAAEALFDEGVAAMKDGRFDEGCPSIAESHRMEPRPGTLFTLAECHRLQGKAATALARYREYLRIHERMGPSLREAQRGRDEVAREHVTALQGKVPKLTIVGDALPDGAVIERAGTAIGAPSLGKKLPIDPGTHAITVTAPGYHPLTREVTVAEGDAAVVTLPAMVPLPAPPAPVVKPIIPLPASTPMPMPEPDGMSTMRVSSIALLSMSGATLVAASVIGGIALQRGSSIRDEECTFPGGRCSATGAEELEDVQSLSHGATAAFVLSGLLAAGGVTLWLLEPEAAPVQVGFYPGGMSLRGAF